MLQLRLLKQCMPLHVPSFRYEFAEWWREVGRHGLFNMREWASLRPKNHPFMGYGSFFSYCYRKGWVPKKVLSDLIPFAMLLVCCVALILTGPFPNPLLALCAILMLLNLLWFAIHMWWYCRLAILDILIVMIPLLPLVSGNL